MSTVALAYPGKLFNNPNDQPTMRDLKMRTQENPK